MRDVTEVGDQMRAFIDLQDLLAATDVSALFLDRRLRIRRFTPSVAELFEIRDTDRGRPIADLASQLGYDELADDASTVLCHLAPIEREVRDESGRWFLTRLLVYRSTDDRIEGVVVTFVDISGQKRTEHAMRENERRIRHLSDAVPGALFATDASGVVDHMSEQFRSLTGVDPDTVVGTAMWPDLVHEDDCEQVEAAWREARAEVRDFEVRHRLDHVADGHRWVMVRAHPILDDDGEVVEWFGTITDVDALVQAEQAQQDANEILERRVEERTAQLRELASRLTLAEQDARRRVGRLLHDDLQQQLYSIRTRLAFVRDDVEIGDVDSALHHLAGVEEALDDSVDITRRLTVDLSPPLLGADRLGEALQWLVSNMADLHHFAVELDVRDAPDVRDDDLRVLLFHATRELLFNVVKHAGAEGAVVDVSAASGEVVIRVRDRGTGFDPASVEEEHGGTGMGLFSVRERLRLVGGDLEIESSDAGTTAVIRAPTERCVRKSSTGGSS